MAEWAHKIALAWHAMAWLEAIAVVLAVAYLILASKENIWCWLCAFISTAIYIFLFRHVALYSESLLNVYYLLMAIYGWRVWLNKSNAAVLNISTWSPRTHGLVIAATGFCVPLLGYWMQSQGADFPYLDAFTTCYAVVTTYMVARKVLENWIYWFVIDSVSIYLYLQKGLLLTATLFASYLILIIFGFLRWQREYRLHNPVSPLPA